jgi:outer membrane protein assembly factor BamA
MKRALVQLGVCLLPVLAGAQDARPQPLRDVAQGVEQAASEVGRAVGDLGGFVSGDANPKIVTQVHIEGMKTRREHEVLSLMGGRLYHVVSSPPSPPLADDAAFLVRQVLRKDGYSTAEVDWRIGGRDSIVLTVREGMRLSLGKVTVNGVPSDETKKFAKLYAKPAEKTNPLLATTPPFREEDVEKGLSFVKQELNARGYWAAEVVVTSRNQHPDTGVVDMVIDAKPGPVHMIGKPVVTSVDGRGVKLAADTAAPFAGRPATTKNLNAMRLAVEQAAASRGYPDADIRMSRTLENATFVPAFTVNLGTRVRLRNVRVEGLELTHPERVERRMKDMEGEWYDEAAMNKRLREMLATGAFASTRVETTPVGEHVIDATLHFEEAKAREISLGAGFGTYQGMILRTTYADRNLFGNLWGLTSGFEFSTRGILGEARVTDPWLFGSDVAASVRGFALIYNREGYDTYETGFDGSLTWKFGDHYKVELLGGSSVVNLTGDGLPSWQLGESPYVNPLVRVTQSLDYRDNAVLPKSGWHLENPFELGAAVASTSTSYVRTGLSGGWYHELSRKSQIGVGGEWGLLVPSGNGQNLPIDLRLFNGGARSVRSFPERELGPTYQGFPTGGEAAWSANLEFIREIAGPVRGVVFFDAGSLARNHEDWMSSDVELATGLGVRLDLPIGPVRAEYGYNLTRDRDEPVGTFHFAIGYAY